MISIITVVLNDEAHIERTIESVMNNSRDDDIEYIIVDGGSTDATLDIINRCRSNAFKIVSERDKGIYDAMNKGLQMASGDIIAFLNSGDYYEDNALEIVGNVFQDADTDIVIGKTYLIQEDNSKIIRVDTPETIEYVMPCCHQAIFARKNCFVDRAFDTFYRICADYDWLLRMYHQKKKIRWIEDFLVNFRLGGFSTQKAMDLMFEMSSIIISNIDNAGDPVMSMVHARRNLDLAICAELRDSHPKVLSMAVSRAFPENDGIVLWGFDIWEQLTVDALLSGGTKIKYIVDNHQERTGMYKGMEIKSPEQLHNSEYVLIIAMNDEGVADKLKSLKFKRDHYRHISEIVGC